MANKTTQFPKGVSGNPKGKPKGAKNKFTPEFIENVSNHLVDLHPKFVTTMQEIQGARFAEAYIKLLSKFLPQVNINENSTQHSGKIKIEVSYGNDEDKIAEEQEGE